MITCCRDPEITWVSHCPDDSIHSDCEEKHCHRVCKNCDNGVCEEC